MPTRASGATRGRQDEAPEDPAGLLTTEVILIRAPGTGTPGDAEAICTEGELRPGAGEAAAIREKNNAQANLYIFVNKWFCDFF